jgi:mycofactocin precursor
MSHPKPDAPPTETDVSAEALEVAGEEALVEAELLVEDVSIDGMCGVY